MEAAELNPRFSPFFYDLQIQRWPKGQNSLKSSSAVQILLQASALYTTVPGSACRCRQRYRHHPAAVVIIRTGDMTRLGGATGVIVSMFITMAMIIRTALCMTQSLSAS